MITQLSEQINSLMQELSNSIVQELSSNITQQIRTSIMQQLQDNFLSGEVNNAMFHRKDTGLSTRKGAVPIKTNYVRGKTYPRLTWAAAICEALHSSNHRAVHRHEIKDRCFAMDGLHLKKEDNTFSASLAHTVNSGLIERVGWCLYSLTETGREYLREHKVAQ